MKPVIAVSAVNFVEAGPLAIAAAALETLAAEYGATHEIVALVHRKSLFRTPNITYLEFPEVKRSWLRRLKFEFFDLRALSRRLNADLWLSLHDITPAVFAKRQAVYCHNAAPFYRLRCGTVRMDPGFSLFVLLYRHLYRIHIHRNACVIVQQDWMRQEFRRLYGLDNVVVAHPETARPGAVATSPAYIPGTRACRFFYPAYPRVFKNAEVLLEAARMLSRRRAGEFEVVVTFDGSENRYSAAVASAFRNVEEVRFAGVMPRSEVEARYGETDCLVFPSMLESWGMPLSEFKRFARPMLVADMPYARETVGDHPATAFFDPRDAAALAELMETVVDGRFGARPASAPFIATPYCRSWSELFRMLVPATETRMEADITAGAHA